MIKLNFTKNSFFIELLIFLIFISFITSCRAKEEIVKTGSGEVFTVINNFSSDLKKKFSIYDKNGKEMFNLYFLDGKLYDENDNGFTGTLRVLQVKDQERYYLRTQYLEGLVEGIHEVYDNQYNLLFSINYSNNVMDGLYKSYYISGNLKVDGVYKEGKAAGLFKEYYKNGILKSEIEYDGDKPDGAFKKYYESGESEIVGFLKNGKMDGKYKWYDRKGNLVREAAYKVGALDGIDKRYLNGKKVYEATLKDGEIVGEPKVEF